MIVQFYTGRDEYKEGSATRELPQLLVEGTTQFEDFIRQYASFTLDYKDGIIIIEIDLNA